MGGDGAEGGGGALRGPAEHAAPTACRPCSPSSPATCASSARSRAASSRRSRTSTPCSSASSATARRRRRACARSSSSGFAHRRKALARSLSLGARRRPRASATARARRCEALGHPADARAESLSPARLAGPVGAPVPLTTLAPGKVNLCLLVGAPRADGLHPLVSVVQPTDLADEVSLEPADRDEVICPGVDGDEPRLPRARGVPLRHRLGDHRAAARRSPSGSRSPPAWRAAPATPPPRCGSPRRPPASRSRPACRCASAPT